MCQEILSILHIHFFPSTVISTENAQETYLANNSSTSLLQYRNTTQLSMKIRPAEVKPCPETNMNINNYIHPLPTGVLSQQMTTQLGLIYQ